MSWRIKDAATTTVYNVNCDGNGNVVKLTKASDGTVAASYEYSPFGELIESTGAYAASNPFRFSTKYHDESQLLYYGYRYLNPETGRWLSRDPIEELGFFQEYTKGNDWQEIGGLYEESLHPAYLFARNNPINLVDAFGLKRISFAATTEIKRAAPPLVPKAALGIKTSHTFKVDDKTGT